MNFSYVSVSEKEKSTTIALILCGGFNLCSFLSSLNPGLGLTDNCLILTLFSYEFNGNFVTQNFCNCLP